MTSQYQYIINEYISEVYLGFNQVVPKGEWGNMQAAMNYLSKYWLPNEQYVDIWQPIQKSIFTNYGKSLDDFIFTHAFSTLVVKGDCLFIEEDFMSLKKCMKVLNEPFFVVLENVINNSSDLPPIKMKFPVDITWEELISGNFVSSLILDNPMKEFFVFGESGLWGKYAANDYVSATSGLKPTISKGLS